MIMVMATSAVGVMKMGNNVPRAGLKPTSLAFWASVLPLHHVDSLMSPLSPHPPVYAAQCLRGQCRLLHSSPQMVNLLMLTITYIQAMALDIHTQGRFNDHTACIFTGSWSRHQCCGCDENGKYCASSGTRTHTSSIPG